MLSCQKRLSSKYVISDQQEGVLTSYNRDVITQTVLTNSPETRADGRIACICCDLA